ncbi:MAG TPA: amino acid ABC transporter substrate-binding protein [Polaromonas sp.]|uniref:amino acid ABC transporter substrate-binding protein n=1 Tax=Polaromonas sp. TaxID=1869339 RepID=UPI002D5AE127|nr:amino acid ABC transporter substrate-binding protein [Polaromonas sp.]HYW57831.1 amino acid ABC transporter substrate-binding protein [Polaromonas sp.]
MTRESEKYAGACFDNRLQHQPIIRGYMPIARPAALVAAIIVLASVAETAVAQATFERIKSRGQINIGYRPLAQPFAMDDATGKPAGYAVEFCNAIADRLAAQTGVTNSVRYIPVDVDRRLLLLREGHIDMLCDSLSANEERGSVVGFSAPIFYDNVQVMVRSKDKITTLDQLKNQTVVVINTTTANKAVASYSTATGAGIKVSRAVGADAAFAQLQLGWAKGYARDGVLLASQKSSLPNSADFDILPTPLSLEPLAIGISRADPAMKALADSVIADAMKAGTMQTWYSKYFLSPTPFGKALNIPMSDRLKEQVEAVK